MDLLHVIAGDGRALATWSAAHREEVRRRLHEHGAVLLRGFDTGGVDGFQAAVTALSGEPLPYTERSSPRSTIKGRVYTSTDYPPSEEIFFHNENSYQLSWPLTLYFYCRTAPGAGGATPLSDTRRVLAAIDPAVVEEFTRRRWMVVRNFGEEFGLPWPEVFGTHDPDEVERICAAGGIRAQWLGPARLRTTAVRDAVHRHPGTGEASWFNHATIFHVSTLPAPVRDGLLELYGEAGLPSNTYYGDGGAIPPDVLEHLRAAYRGAATRFDYEAGDVLVVDNMSTAHGREPFTGPRDIAVAMAEPHGAPS
ncbi:TauD/TfdA family dioxygenase [Dactylosporangium salmoneum]|uniref:TauD/TfdA family dioxygenase n=1 Tax=Dactylosporangium salmoneum TaxID=53361 RepID=A0ABN3GTI7_9ACTN